MNLFAQEQMHDGDRLASLRRLPKWFVVATAAVAVFLIAVSLLPEPPVAANPAQAQLGNPALNRLAACVTGHKQLAVVMLIDESASLRQTDPLGGRVVAARAAVNGLAELVRRSNGKVRVDVQVAGFAVDYQRSPTWTTLAPETAASVDAAVQSFVSRSNGIDTDYVNALQGAQSEIQSHARSMGGDTNETCTAVLWFTDGRYDVEDRINGRQKKVGTDNSGNAQSKEYARDIDLYHRGGGAATVARGKQILCDAGGVADQYRTSETSLFAVALATQIPADDQSFLESVVQGPNCGNRDGTTNGALLTGDIGEMIGAFDQIVTALGNPANSVDQEIHTCPLLEDTCPQGTQTFDIDPTLQRFHVLAQMDAPGVAVRFTSPGGTPLSVPPVPVGTETGQGATGDTHLAWSWLSPQALTVDAEAGSGTNPNWVGTWTATFIDTTGRNPGAPVHARIYVFGEVTPELAAGTIFRAGEKNTFRVNVVGVGGSPVPATALGPANLTATITDPSTGHLTNLGPLVRQGDSYTGTWTAPPELSAPSVNLGLTVTVTTRTGVALAPSGSTTAVDVRPPVGFPEVGTHRIDIGPIEGTGSAEARLAILGSRRSATCVWLADVRIESGPLPTGTLNVDAGDHGSASSECLQIPKDGKGELVLRVSPKASERGVEVGTIFVGTRSLNGDEVRTVPIALTAQLVKSADAGMAWLLFTILIVGGISLPLAIFYLANRRAATFAPLKLMVGCEVPIELCDPVDGSLTLRRTAAAPPSLVGVAVPHESLTSAPLGLGDPVPEPPEVHAVDPTEGVGLLRTQDFRAVAPQQDTERPRYFEFASVKFKASVSRNPLRPPDGIASIDDRRQVLGSARGSAALRPGRSGRSGRIPLWINGEWVLIVNDVHDDDAPVTGQLVAFLLATEVNSSVGRLNEHLADRLPALRDTALRLRTVEVPDDANSETDPFGEEPAPDSRSGVEIVPSDWDPVPQDPTGPRNHAPNYPASDVPPPTPPAPTTRAGVEGEDPFRHFDS